MTATSRPSRACAACASSASPEPRPRPELPGRLEHPRRHRAGGRARARRRRARDRRRPRRALRAPRRRGARTCTSSSSTARLEPALRRRARARSPTRRCTSGDAIALDSRALRPGADARSSPTCPTASRPTAILRSDRGAARPSRSGWRWSSARSASASPPRPARSAYGLPVGAGPARVRGHGRAARSRARCSPRCRTSTPCSSRCAARGPAAAAGAAALVQPPASPTGARRSPGSLALAPGRRPGRPRARARGARGARASGRRARRAARAGRTCARWRRSWSGERSPQLAPGKVNLCLFALGPPREDGRHELVIARPAADAGRRAGARRPRPRLGRATRSTARASRAPNLAAAALAAFRARDRLGRRRRSRLTIVKRVPVAAGMGGGSATPPPRCACAAAPRARGRRAAARARRRPRRRRARPRCAPGACWPTGAGERLAPLPEPRALRRPASCPHDAPALDRRRLPRGRPPRPAARRRAGWPSALGRRARGTRRRPPRPSCWSTTSQPAARSLRPAIDAALGRCAAAGARRRARVRLRADGLRPVRRPERGAAAPRPRCSPTRGAAAAVEPVADAVGTRRPREARLARRRRRALVGSCSWRRGRTARRRSIGFWALVAVGALRLRLGRRSTCRTSRSCHQRSARRSAPWTYLLVGALAFLETGAFVGLIAPGETAILLGGFVAGQGKITSSR